MSCHSDSISTTTYHLEHLPQKTCKRQKMHTNLMLSVLLVSDLLLPHYLEVYYTCSDSVFFQALFSAFCNKHLDFQSSKKSRIASPTNSYRIWNVLPLYMVNTTLHLILRSEGHSAAKVMW